MNDYGIETRKRNQTLILVEGDHEKEYLLKLVLKCFPELPVKYDNIHIYGTDIYDLYHAIEKEYDQDWDNGELEIDIPLLISRRIWVLSACLHILGDYKFFWRIMEN